jgi:diguanylate cyclase (GGDEF)-like protein
MNRPPFDFGPDGPPPAAHVRPWRDLVTELHDPAEKAFRLLAERTPLDRGVLWLHDRDHDSLRAVAVWTGGEVWDGEEDRPLARLSRLRQGLERDRRRPFSAEGALWAPLRVFESPLGFLELRPWDGKDETLLMEAARGLALSVWRVASSVHDRRRDMHLRTLSEVSVLIHQSLKPARLLEDVSRRLVRHLGLDRLKVYLWDARRRLLKGEIAFTLMEGARDISRETFDPAAWKGDEAPPRVRHAVPLAVGGETLGWMAADNLLSQQEIAMDEVHLLETVAGQLALAVRNAALYEGVETLATTDELTKLLLARVFNQRLEEEFQRSSRSKTPFAVCMLDVDKFKSVNDTHGHPVGDRVLSGVARRLKAVSRKMDVVARYAGDEFIILLPHTAAGPALNFAQRLVENVRRLSVPTGVGDAVVKPTVSVGVAVYPDHGARADELVRAADEALYAAKHAGRDGAALHGT